MSDLAYLDGLSNSELRQKCIEYKLPNVPITDTSRNIMVRRLRTAILGTSAQVIKTPKGKRRETMPVGTKTSTPVRVDKSPSRVAHTKNLARSTIGNTRNVTITKTLSSSDIGSQSEEEDYMKRQFPKQAISSNRSVKTTTTLSSSDIGSQSEEEEAFNNYNYRQPIIARDDQRLRRSVSLTKTGVLTTSYTQEASPLRNNVYNKTDELDNKVGQEGHFEAPKYSVYSNPLAEAHTLPSYVPTFERKIQSNLGTRPNLTQTQLHSNSFGINQNDNFNANPFQPSTYSGSSAPFSYGNPHASSILKHSQPKPVLRPKRKIKTTVTADGGRTLYPRLNDFYDEIAVDAAESSLSEAEDDIMMDVDEPEIETPYSSKFTRNLETAARSSFANSSNPVGVRRSLVQKDEDNVQASLKQFLTALEQKYHLKQTFAILIIILLSIFLYIMLSP